MTLARVALAAVVLALAAAGCGDDPPRLTESAAQELAGEVAAIRSAAAADDRAGAEAAVAGFLERLDALVDQGQVSDEAAAEIAAEAEAVLTELDAITTTTTTTTTTEAPKDDEGDKDDEGEDRDKGNGGKGGDDD